MPIVEQIQEVVARRAGEIALVVVMRHRQHDDQVRSKLERDARDERVGALGERGEERERASRIGGLQLDEHFADRRIEQLAVRVFQVAMPRDANEEWNHPDARSRVRRRVIARSTDVGLEAAFGSAAVSMS